MGSGKSTAAVGECRPRLGCSVGRERTAYVMVMSAGNMQYALSDAVHHSHLSEMRGQLVIPPKYK